MKKAPFLSVVVPCYNEEDNIKNGSLEALNSYLTCQSYSFEVIIVDDGSTDFSYEKIRAFSTKTRAFRLLRTKHQGKAGAVTKGVLSAQGEIVLFTDFDQATPIQEIEKLLPFLNRYDVVIGSRRNEREGAPISRIIMARGFMALRNIVLDLSLFDTQCGFKAFKQQAVKTLFRTLRLYQNGETSSGSRVTAGFDVEILFLAKKLGYSIKEVPVAWHYVETRRVNPIRDSWEGFLDLVRIKLNDIRGVYH